MVRDVGHERCMCMTCSLAAILRKIIFHVPETLGDTPSLAATNSEDHKELLKEVILRLSSLDVQ